MLTIGLTFEDAEVAALFEDLDVSGDGTINIEEFTERLEKFKSALSESAETTLLHLCQHLDRERVSLADVFRGVDVDESGNLTLEEFSEALLRLNIPHQKEGAIAVMEELDLDGESSDGGAASRLANTR
jgi:Ca2+-binding EF-hand superfamily protein